MPKYKNRMIILSVATPSTPKETEAIQAWLQVALNLADLLVKGPGLKSEVSCRQSGWSYIADPNS
jgi:hypothetical protein